MAKRFRFKFKSLLALRAIEEKHQMMNVAGLNKERVILVEKLRQLDAKDQGCRRNLEDRLAATGPLDAALLMSLFELATGLETDRRRTHEALDAVQDKLRDEQAAFAQISAKRKALEQHRQKLKKQHEHQSDREEENEQGDLTLGRFRKSGMGPAW